MCKLKPLLSRWLEEADSAQGQLPQTGGDKHSQQVNITNIILLYYNIKCYTFLNLCLGS